MQIVVKLSNGELLGSDSVDYEALANDPEVIGQGGVEASLDGVRELLKDYRSMDGLRLIVDGEMVYVNPAHIMWAKVVTP